MASKIFLFCFIAFLVSACGIHETKNAANVNVVTAALTADPSNQITYAQVNQLLISQSCMSCHSDSSARGGVALTTYAKVNAVIDEMKDDIDSGDMPEDGSLSPTQIALFDQWYSQGHLEFGGVPPIIVFKPTPTSTPDPAASPSPTLTPSPTPVSVLIPGVTFAQVNQAVFQASCMDCHSPSAASGHVVLDTFQNVSLSLADVITDIDSGDMPEGGVLTATQLNIFKSWIAEGATEFGVPAPTPTPIPSAHGLFEKFVKRISL